jgi:flagellar basal body P-ring protein FlgI
MSGNMKTKRTLIFALLAIVGMGWQSVADAVRLKDIAEINGVRKNQLVGYGLVVGLDGSGDGKKGRLYPAVHGLHAGKNGCDRRPEGH